jgi:hypothetical protein
MRKWREASVIPIEGRFCQHVFGRFGRTLPGIGNPAIRTICVRRWTPYEKKRPPDVIRGPRAIKDRLRRSRSAQGQISCSCRTGRKDRSTTRAHSASARHAAAWGSTPSYLPEEPGPEPEPAWGPEPCWGPGSERQEPRSSGPTHSRRRNQPGHSSSVCSSRRRPRIRTVAEPSLRDGGRGDHSQPKRR